MTFPSDIIKTLRDYIGQLPDVTINGVDFGVGDKNQDGTPSVYMREPRPNDPNCSAYVFASRNVEIDHCIGHTFPNRTAYDIEIVLLIKLRDEEEAIEAVSTLTDNLRSLIYGDVALRDDLNALSYASGGATHTVSKFKVTGQRFVTPATEGKFIAMTMTSLRFDVTTQS